MIAYVILHKPWRSDRVESGDYARNVYGSPYWDFNFRYQKGQWKNDAKEEERNHVSYDLPDEKEAVDNVKLLPEIHSLHKQNKTLWILLMSILVTPTDYVARTL